MEQEKCLEWHGLLVQTFEERKKKNSSYSLRAFARDLGVSQPQLSRLFNQIQDLSPLQAYKIAKYLKMDVAESYNLIINTLEKK